MLTIPVLLGVATLVFALLHLVPGDPAQVMLGESAAASDVDELRAKLGLDRPLPAQYAQFMRGVVQGDFGTSFRYGTPVFQEIAQRLPNTLRLALAAMSVALLIAVPLGVLGALYRGRAIDQAAMAVSLVGISMPNFWLGPLLAIVFAVSLGWLPVSGIGDWRHLVLPSVTLGAALAAILARMTRASLIEELRELYVLAARAGALTDASGAAARAAQQSDSGGDHPRPAVRGGADRHDHHRDHFFVAGHRTAAHSGDQLPRLSTRAGLHPVHRDYVCDGESARGSHLRLA